jgi:hypothetical protein
VESGDVEDITDTFASRRSGTRVLNAAGKKPMGVGAPMRAPFFHKTRAELFVAQLPPMPQDSLARATVNEASPFAFASVSPRRRPLCTRLHHHPARDPAARGLLPGKYRGNANQVLATGGIQVAVAP